MMSIPRHHNLLLEYFNGTITVDGNVIAPFESGGPLLRFGYQVLAGASEAKGQKDEIWVGRDEAEVCVDTSSFMTDPLFYCHKGDRLFISNSVYRLSRDLLDRKFQLELDRIAFFETLLFDYPLRERTLFKCVHKMLPGKRYRFDLTTGSVQIEDTFLLPFHNGRSVRDEKSLLRDAKDILSSLITPETAIDGASVLLPLSGGLDSRLLACLLRRQGIDFTAAVFGPPESTERLVARKVVRGLGIELQEMPLPNAYYKTYGDEVTRLTAGLSNHRHCHLYAALKANDLKADVIFHGYLGGEYAGAAQKSVGQRYNLSPEAALEQFVQAHVQNTFIWGVLSESDRQQILADLREIMEECCRVNLPCHFDEYVHNVERQFGLIANVFGVCEEFGRLVRPFANEDYAVFFNTLPYFYRHDRYLFRKACRELFARPFAIGTQSQLYARDTLAGQTEAVVSRLASVASFGSFVATRSRFVLPNPKGCERHRQVLFGVLRTDFLRALDGMSDLIGIDLTPLGQINLRNRSELTSQFRVLSADLVRREFLKGTNDIHSTSELVVR